MSDYYNVTTNNGDAAIATAIVNNTKLNITHIAFGDGNGAVPTPNKARTTLVKEVYRQAIAKYQRHPTIANYLIVEVVIPSDIGGFYIREIGLIADGILISHGSHAPFFKVAEPNGVSEFYLKYTINIQDGGVVDLTLDESLIYATETWVEDNYLPRTQLVDNLTSNDATKPVTAKQAKVLQDNKLDKSSNAVSATKLNNPRKINNVSFDGTVDIVIYDATKFNAEELTATSDSYPEYYYKSGVYKINNGGTSDLLLHFKAPSASASAVQFLAHYGNNGLFYRSAQDESFPYGFDRIVTESGGVAPQAIKLKNARTITLTGAAQGSGDFDGSGNLNISTVGLGVGQTWQDLIATRTKNTTYTNSTGKPIQVLASMVTTSSDYIDIWCNGVRIFTTSNVSVGEHFEFSFIVPHGSPYSITINSHNLLTWAELR